MVKKGDRVKYKGRAAKVMAHPSGNGTVTLHVGEGAIVRDVLPSQYEVISEPEPQVEAKPQGTAPRQRSKPGGRSR